MLIYIFGPANDRTLWRFPPVLLSIVGVTLISLGDVAASKSGEGLVSSHSKGETLRGEIFAAVTAPLAAAYMLIFNKFLRAMKLQAVLFFLGCIGIWAVLLCWSPFVITWLLSGKPLFSHGAVPPMYPAVICATCVISVLFNLSLNFGITKSSPLFMRTCLIMSVPVSLIIDIIALGEEVNWQRILGCIAVVTGLVSYNARELIMIIRGGAKQSSSSSLPSSSPVSESLDDVLVPLAHDHHQINHD